MFSQALVSNLLAAALGCMGCTRVRLRSNRSELV